VKLKISRCAASPANRIYILDVLGGEGLQTGRGNYEKLRDEVTALMPDQVVFISEKIFHKCCSDLDEVKEFFSSIKDECNASTFPLIFIDGHGDKLYGLVLPSGEYLDWNSLNSHLAEVTLKAGGQSTVIASFCFSMTAVARPSYEEPLPSPFYYGYSDEIAAGVIRQDCSKLIEELLRRGTFDQSGKSIKLYSEYDHVTSLIAPLVAKFTHSQDFSEFHPYLSKNKLRTLLHAEIGAKFGTTKGLNEVLKKALDPKVLLAPILEKAMHNTERRSRLIDELISQI
jgi:hypothetical protein